METEEIQERQTSLTASKMQGAKYSKNLAAWLRHQKSLSLSRVEVYSDANDKLWIGQCNQSFDADGGMWLNGSGLMHVLCEGRRAASMAFPIGPMMHLTLVEGFWSRYREIGRCAIDPMHKIGFLDDAARWSVDGDTRSCVWCGGAKQVMRRWTEVIEKSAWVGA